VTLQCILNRVHLKVQTTKGKLNYTWNDHTEKVINDKTDYSHK